MTGVRLHFVVEGQTEETFVRDVLVAYLSGFSVFADVRSVTTGRRRGAVYRGGLTGYDKPRRDIGRWMREDRTAAFTTMFDLYRLPADFPGCEQTKRLSGPRERVEAIELAMSESIGAVPRFIPHIQLHEFETLILADPQKLSVYYDDGAAIQRLVSMASSFESPELIDDGRDTAPSRRIIAEIPEYEHAKVAAGPVVVAEIGLPTLRRKCPHFSEWLAKLEALGAEGAG